jgi:hypothetical protein
MLIKSNFIPSEIFERFLLNDSILKDKPITIYHDYTPTLEELNINPYNILLLSEPNELFGLHDWAIKNHNAFSCILTWGQNVLDNCPNSMLFPFGMSFLWETPEFYENINQSDKKFKSFFVCGEKQMIEGHRFRHKVYNIGNYITTPHNWIYSCQVEEKNNNFIDSMFHVAIENTKNLNYFTEKIIDCFLTKTIPIYRGCPNIEGFFDGNGIITFDTEEELINILNNLTEKDYWKRKQAIETNYNSAVHWKDYYNRLMVILKEIIKINEI